MKITIDVHENYGGVLTVTAIGRSADGVNVSTFAVKLREVNLVELQEDGTVKYSKVKEVQHEGDSV